ncbi:hypothetical protein BWI92_21170 [Flectobacillus sp. BAB-3569]|nr:hypothetical protein BWI92_21170 [Flectobacillus sp. BAB-3569]
MQTDWLFCDKFYSFCANVCTALFPHLIKKNKIILNFVSNCMGIKSTTISYFVKSMRVHRPHFRTTGELVHDGLTISI